MQIKVLCPYSFGANTYLIHSGSCAYVVDPAVSVAAITSAAAELDVCIKGILLTHGHFDHTISLDTLRKALDIPAFIHEEDAVMLTDGRKNAYYDFYGKECKYSPAENIFSDNDMITVGDEKIRIIHTPGHSGGSVCMLADEFMITGDTLFAESIGRCDLWSGSQALMKSSLERLRTFSPNLTIYPGHGMPSSLGNALDNSLYYL
ncbi:MAG: MBL fold metallo-hydrolase [Clostridia bacterium]|nr:MBL fold metallo-hydrolase [Clostridia bacterium]